VRRCFSHHPWSAGKLDLAGSWWAVVQQLDSARVSTQLPSEPNTAVALEASGFHQGIVDA
jgi:hypothetical protein